MKSRIALFLHHPKCSVQSVNGIIEALGHNYKFKIFTRHEVERDFFDDVDAVCFPGGFGDADSYDYLLPEHISHIREFVHRGGKYLGICMGAYWAGSYYFNILNNVEPVQYIKQPSAVTRRPHAKAMPVTWNNEQHHMYFYDGCTFTGASSYETVATYPYGLPMAIIQDNIGLIGCHPESQQHWYDEYSWLKGQWPGPTQYNLLDQFVAKLLQ